MTARDLNAMADRWEMESAHAPRDRRTAPEKRMDALFECVGSKSGPGCLPCLLDELE
jgi:hypothetical protein